MAVRKHSFHNRTIFYFLIATAGLSAFRPIQSHAQPVFEAFNIFPLQQEHVHGPTIVELSNGDLLAGWFQGSGERWADDVRIMGAKLHKGEKKWSRPFLLADTPEFPDINPMMFLDPRNRLWLMWYTVIANQWETSLLKYRISANYEGSDTPVWQWQEVLHVKPGDPAERGIRPNDRFVRAVEEKIEDYTHYLENSYFSEGKQPEAYTQRWKRYTEEILKHARGEDMLRRGRLMLENGSYKDSQMGYPYFRRVGWQTKNKPIIVDQKRLIVPLYSDGFSFSLMAISDDWGQTWSFSEPLVGAGNIQPTLARKKDGTLVAYMRDNGPPPKRMHVSQSADRGMTWSGIRDGQLPNPGAGFDMTNLQNGHWLIVYNDTEEGRHSLAVAVSSNEGQSWDPVRRLEYDARDENATRSHYPAVIQAKDGLIHMVYSYHHNDRQGGPNKTIKYARFEEKWLYGNN